MKSSKFSRNSLIKNRRRLDKAPKVLWVHIDDDGDPSDPHEFSEEETPKIKEMGFIRYEKSVSWED